MQPGDIENDILTISRSIDTNGDITPGKNKNARRRVYLRETAKQILSDQKHFLESKGFGQSDWIFPGFENEQPTPKTSYSEFKRFTAKHGIEGSPYRLRHTWISLMLLHVASQTDANALNDMINYLKDQGYTFETL